ncbi:MAG: hemerythrin domain-containing protein [Myxococcota bacterium]
MTSKVAERILEEHVEMRQQLDEIESLCRRSPSELQSVLGELRSRARTMLDRLVGHMALEDDVLVPALRENTNWGYICTRELERYHREQRQQMRKLREMLAEDHTPAQELTREIMVLGELMREDMRHEEEDLLKPTVIDDSVVGIDVETG